jgi:hypothetical protein
MYLLGMDPADTAPEKWRCVHNHLSVGEQPCDEHSQHQPEFAHCGDQLTDCLVPTAAGIRPVMLIIQSIAPGVVCQSKPHSST